MPVLAAAHCFVITTGGAPVAHTSRKSGLADWILAICGPKLVWLVSNDSSSTSVMPYWLSFCWAESWPAIAYAFLVSVSIASFVLPCCCRYFRQAIATWLESGVVCHMYGVGGSTCWSAASTDTSGSFFSLTSGLIASSAVDCGGPSMATTPSSMSCVSLTTVWLGSDPSSTMWSSILRPLTPPFALTWFTICSAASLSLLP